MSGQNYGSGGYDPNQPQDDQSGYTPPPAGNYSNQPPQGGYENQPQGGYNNQQGGYGNQPPAGGAPNYNPPGFDKEDVNRMMAQGRADLQLLPAKWMKVLSNPSPATFASELPNANWVAIVTNVLVAAVVSGIVFFLLFLTAGVGFGYAFNFFFSALWQTIVQFALGIGLAYVFSTYVFGGRGDVMQLSWALSLSGVPLLIARSILLAIGVRFLPGFLIGLIGLLFWLAVFYYLWMALQAVFKFNSQTAMYAALSTLALPLLGSVLGLFGWSAWLPGLFYAYGF